MAKTFRNLSVLKRVIADTLQVPSTIIPSLLSILSLIYRLFFSDFFGGSRIAVIVMVSTAALAVISFVLRFSKKYRLEYEKQLRIQLENKGLAYRQSRRINIDRLKREVESGFRELNAHKGLEALEILLKEYHALSTLYQGDEEPNLVSAGDLSDLAEETLYQGLNVLIDAIEVCRVIQPEKRLQEELVHIEEEIEILKSNDGSESLIDVRESSAATHRERLAEIGSLRVRLEKLMYQCERCEASLHKTRIELATLRNRSTEDGISMATKNLEKTIREAREVQIELKELGY